MMNKEQKCVAGIKLLSIELNKKGIMLNEHETISAYVSICNNAGIPIKIMRNNATVNVVYIINRRVYDMNSCIYGVPIDEYIMGVVCSVSEISPDMIKTMFDFRNGVSLNRLRGGIQIGCCNIISVPTSERKAITREDIIEIVKNIKRTINL